MSRCVAEIYKKHGPRREDRSFSARVSRRNWVGEAFVPVSWETTRIVGGRRQRPRDPRVKVRSSVVAGVTW